MRSMWQRISTTVHDERGAATAEYAIVIMAAVGFAGLLVVILRDLVQRALNSAG
jgi:Flp pilus assembly pilin Flp